MESDPIFLATMNRHPLPRFAGEGGPKGRVRKRGRHFGAGLITTRAAPGYSMIELVLVILLIGILAAFVGPRFFDLKVFQARGLHDEALSILRYAQKTAVAQRRSVYVNFSVDVNLQATSITACYANADPCSVADGVPNPYGEKPFTVTAGSGVGFAPSTSLFFDALGRPYNAADTIPISTFATNLSISITSGGVSRTISVERETGYVR